MDISVINFSKRPSGDSVDNIAEHIASSASKALRHCKEIWTNMGYSEEDVQKKEASVMDHFDQIIKEMITQEDRLFSAAVQSVKNSREVISTLQNELQIVLVDLDEKLPIIAVEETYRRAAAELQKEKELRLTKLRCLRETLESLCYRLGEPQREISENNNPTLMDLEILQNAVDAKRKILDARTSTCSRYIEEIKELAAALNYTGKNETESNIINSMFPLVVTKDIMERIKLFYKELKINYDNHLKSLQNAYNCKIEALTALWNLCKISSLDRDLFLNRLPDKLNEEAQEKLDEELERLKIYYKKREVILSLVHKLEEALRYKENLNECKMTPARLNNRGCVLLREERHKRAIEKRMIETKCEIEMAIQEWENKHAEDPIMLDGIPANDYLTKFIFVHQQKEKDRSRQSLPNQISVPLSQDSSKRNSSKRVSN